MKFLNNKKKTLGQRKGREKERERERQRGFKMGHFPLDRGGERELLLVITWETP